MFDRAGCRQTLRQVFGIRKLRRGQRKPVRTLLHGRDLICLMPTGGGKSLCYQLPGVIRYSPTIVISPLIALMRDQVEHLKQRGISAICLDSMQTEEEIAGSLRAIAKGKTDFIYVSPERLATKRFREAVAHTAQGLVVVDEAHCIIQWGAEFRPAYAQIADFLRTMPVRPVLCAMTATADDRMIEQIGQTLGMKHPKVYKTPLVRENLRYRIEMSIGTGKTVVRFVAERRSQKGLIFCGTRTAAEKTAQMLVQAGIEDAAYYHAGLPREERLRIQKAFARGDIRVLATTSAFGMGVDIPDIRYIIHRQLPQDFIDYVQQTGRAGRDGAPAECILLFDPACLPARNRQLQEKRDREKPSRKEWQLILEREKQMMDWIFSGECLQRGIVRYFGQNCAPCGKCSACLRRKQERGKRLAPSPAVGRMNNRKILLWTLTWKRSEMIRQGIIRRRELTDTALERAVKTGTVNGNFAGRNELQFLLDHMNRTMR